MKPTKIQDAVAAIRILVTRGNMFVHVKFDDITHVAMLSKADNVMGLMTKCGSESSTDKDVIEQGLVNADAVVTCMMCLAEDR